MCGTWNLNHLCAQPQAVVVQSPSNLILSRVHERGMSCDQSLPQFLYKTVIEAAKTTAVFKELPPDNTRR